VKREAAGFAISNSERTRQGYPVLKDRILPSDTFSYERLTACRHL
jgi:hypothetical protein